METAASTVQPDIVDLDAFTVLGLLTHLGPEEQNERTFGSIWERFERRYDEIRDRSVQGGFFGLRFPCGDPGSVDHLAAIAVAAASPVPEGMTRRSVPALRYAVVSCPLRSIGETYRALFTEWLPRSGYEVDPAGPVFERYPPAGEGPSLIHIHVPLREADRGRG